MGTKYATASRLCPFIDNMIPTASTTHFHSTQAGKAEGLRLLNTYCQHKKGETSDMHVFTYSIVISRQIVCSLSDIVSLMSVCRADMSGGPCKCSCGSLPETQQTSGPALHQRSEQRELKGIASLVGGPTLLSALCTPYSHSAQPSPAPVRSPCHWLWHLW